MWSSAEYAVEAMLEIDSIYNQDCIVGIESIDDHSIDFVVTDPPYWHKKSPAKNPKQSNTKSSFACSNLFHCDGYMVKNMSHFDGDKIDEFLYTLRPKMKIMNAYIFCSEAQVPYYAIWAERNGYMFSILVWEKPLSIINKNRFSQNLEYIVRIYDYGTALNRLPNNEFYNRVKKNAPVSGINKIHPTEKPVSLIEELILLNTNEGDIVLDPYIGSGTTAVACHLTNRHYIGFEINSQYYDKAVSRIKNEHRQLTLFD